MSHFAKCERAQGGGQRPRVSAEMSSERKPRPLAREKTQREEGSPLWGVCGEDPQGGGVPCECVSGDFEARQTSVKKDRYKYLYYRLFLHLIFASAVRFG